MSLTNPTAVVTEERLNEYHNTILPYLGGNSMVACGGGYAPIGTIIAFMGTTAPSDFLACDGSILNIADYTELADFFELQFGSANYFGGNGTTTFAVPDLRGEFLRGTGTNSHNDGGDGGAVGAHQGGTQIPYFYVGKIQDGTKGYAGFRFDSGLATGSYTGLKNTDKAIQASTKARYAGFEGINNESISDPYTYASCVKPTNTSVLYCIKAKSQGNGYSTDEKIVGTWIDGKPIYQKTIVIDNPVNDWTTFQSYGSGIDIDQLIDAKPIYLFADNWLTVSSFHRNNSDYLQAIYQGAGFRLVYTPATGTVIRLTLTIQYTKTTD